VEDGETLAQACIREVEEETGVKTQFSGVLGFREVLKQGKFERPDLYFVCHLEAIDEKIDIQMPDEIAAAEWKDLADLKHLSFTRMAKSVCDVLLKVKEGQAAPAKEVDLGSMGVGDLFRTGGFTKEEYELFGAPNYFYSSELLKSIRGPPPGKL